MGNAFRDGMVHVNRRRCATCIFTPGAFQGLRPGRVEAMVAEADEAHSAIICHETYDVDNAVCHGYFTRRSSMTLRLADATGHVALVEPPKKLL